MDGSVSVSDTITLSVGGMTCKSCENTVHDALISIEGVNSATISHESSTAIVNFKGTNRNVLSNAIRQSGYTVDGLGLDFNWSDGSVWKQSAHNTKWCLIGCSIGDFGTIAAFQFVFTESGWSTMSIMVLAMINGLLTSIALETIILAKQMGLFEGFKVAIGMSLISMIAMEASMNITDYLMTGGAILTWWAIPIMLIVGFITPWPYNYWRLKKFGRACH
jgi:copper chaperone CopZ